METIEVNGLFNDQKGIIKKGKIVGYNNDGIPCRKYTWIDALIPELNNKSFEAFDDQIRKAMVYKRNK